MAEPDPYDLEVLLGTSGPYRLRPTAYSDVLFVFDDQLRIRAVSENIEQMYGYTAEEVLGAQVEEKLRGDSIGEVPRSYVRQVLAGEEVPTVQAVRFRPDGSRFDASISLQPLVDDEGRIRGVAAFVRDIKALVEAREEALQAEARFRAVFEGNRQPMVLVDADTRTLLANQAHADLFGYAIEEILGETLDLITLPEDQIRNSAIVELLHQGQLPPQGVKRAYRRKDGRTIWLVVSLSILRRPKLGDKGEFLAQYRDVTEEEAVSSQLKYLADHDPLTTVCNRRAFDERALEHVKGLYDERRKGARGALLLIDLDHFKEQNDRHGHARGDAVLVAVADAMRSHVRDTDVVGRMGGDEFAILLPNVDRGEAEAFATNMLGFIKDGAAEVADDNDLEVPVTATIGIAGFDDLPDYDTAYHRADMAMYEAKTAGRDCWVTHWE